MRSGKAKRSPLNARRYPIKIQSYDVRSTAIVTLIPSGATTELHALYCPPPQSLEGLLLVVEARAEEGMRSGKAKRSPLNARRYPIKIQSCDVRSTAIVTLIPSGATTELQYHFFLPLKPTCIYYDTLPHTKRKCDHIQIRKVERIT